MKTISALVCAFFTKELRMQVEYHFIYLKEKERIISQIRKKQEDCSDFFKKEQEQTLNVEKYSFNELKKVAKELNIIDDSKSDLDFLHEFDSIIEKVKTQFYKYREEKSKENYDIKQIHEFLPPHRMQEKPRVGHCGFVPSEYVVTRECTVEGMQIREIGIRTDYKYGWKGIGKTYHCSRTYQ